MRIGLGGCDHGAIEQTQLRDSGKIGDGDGFRVADGFCAAQGRERGSRV